MNRIWLNRTLLVIDGHNRPSFVDTKEKIEETFSWFLVAQLCVYIRFLFFYSNLNVYYSKVFKQQPQTHAEQTEKQRSKICNFPQSKQKFQSFICSSLTLLIVILISIFIFKQFDNSFEIQDETSFSLFAYSLRLLLIF